MIQLIWAVAMVLLVCAFLAGAVLVMFRRLAKRYPPVSYSIYHRPYLGGKTWTEPVLDETDLFEEGDDWATWLKKCVVTGRWEPDRKPIQSDTDRFIEEMDKKLEQPDIWRHVK